MTIFITVLVLLALFFCVVIYHDTHNFVIRSYTIETDKIKKNFRFCLLSDLHEQSFDKDGSNESLIEAIDTIRPDAIVVAGDLLTAHHNSKKQSAEVPIRLLSALASKYPIYMANGNHEYKMMTRPEQFGDFYDSYERQLSDIGLSVLHNESTFLEDYNINITGLELEYTYFRKVRKYPLSQSHLKELINTPDESRFNLLIAHNPQYFDEYAEWGADLSVSGHVHGGIVKLPMIGGVISPAYQLFPKYDGGMFDIGGKKMVLSRGLGTHTIKVRVFNPGELDVIDLKVK